ncbi:MAG: hypothetical protein AAFQ89_16535 [Cyanobacteria bacterium J06626_18]
MKTAFPKRQTLGAYSLRNAAADCGLEALRLKLLNAPLDLPQTIVDAMSDNVLTDLAEALEGLGYEVVEDIRYQGEEKTHAKAQGAYPQTLFWHPGGTIDTEAQGISYAIFEAEGEGIYVCTGVLKNAKPIDFEAQRVRLTEDGFEAIED